MNREEDEISGFEDGVENAMVSPLGISSNNQGGENSSEKILHNQCTTETLGKFVTLNISNFQFIMSIFEIVQRLC